MKSSTDRATEVPHFWLFKMPIRKTKKWKYSLVFNVVRFLLHGGKAA